MTLGVGQILSDTFAMVRSRFWRLVGLYFVWFAILAGFSILAMVVVGGGAAALAGSLEDPGALGGLGAGFLVTMAIVYLGYILISSAQNAAMCTMASPLRNGDFGDAMGSGVRAALPMLGVMILLILGYVVLFAIVGALAAAIGSVGAIIGYIAVFALLLWLGARIGIVLAVVPVDGVRNPIAAIGRAWNLTAGNALPIMLSFLAFIVIGGAAIAALFVPMLGSIGSIQQGGTPGVGSMLFLVFGLLIVVIVFLVAYAAMISTIHGKLAGGANAAAAFE